MSFDLFSGHVNFHIGAPNVAPVLLKKAARTKALREDASTHAMLNREFRKYLKPILLDGEDPNDLLVRARTVQDPFFQMLKERAVLAISQHLFMAHPDYVVRDGQFLPGAERRVARLADLFRHTTLDLHLTIQNPKTYVPFLPTANRKGIDLAFLPEEIPSWLDLASRLRQACPDNRIVVWDFSDLARMALPFAITLINADEALANTIEPYINASVQYDLTLSRVVQQDFFDSDAVGLVDREYARDLSGIAALPNTILVQSEDIPEEFFPKDAQAGN